MTNDQVRFKKWRVGLLALFSCVAGLIGFVAFAITYWYARDTSPPPVFAAAGTTPFFEGYALDGYFDFMLLALYCFVVGIITVPHVGRLAPLLAGLLMTLGGTMIAFNVGPPSQDLYRLWFGALGGLVSAGLVLPCLYLHKYWILGHSYRGQFSLKGLLLVVLAVSLLMGALNLRREYFQKRAAAVGWAALNMTAD
jgi:hypothetical protein